MSSYDHDKVLNSRVKNSFIWHRIQQGVCPGCDSKDNNIPRQVKGHLAYFCSKECIQKVKDMRL